MTDLVSGGAEPTSRRTRVALIAAVLLALLALGGDRWWADRERARLGEAVLAGEQVVTGSRSSLAGLAAYSAGLLYAADVLPWHTGIREAREAYDQRLAAWADVLRRFAEGPQSGVGDDPAVTQAPVAAREALRAAGLDALD